LAIVNEHRSSEDPHTHPPGGILEYYRQNVIGGRGAFALVAKAPSSFGQAVVDKLVGEIAKLQAPLGARNLAAHAAPSASVEHSGIEGRGRDVCWRPRRSATQACVQHQACVCLLGEYSASETGRTPSGERLGQEAQPGSATYLPDTEYRRVFPLCSQANTDPFRRSLPRGPSAR
jgi:hypothetical protein